MTKTAYVEDLVAVMRELEGVLRGSWLGAIKRDASRIDRQCLRRTVADLSLIYVPGCPVPIGLRTPKEIWELVRQVVRIDFEGNRSLPYADCSYSIIARVYWSLINGTDYKMPAITRARVRMMRHFYGLGNEAALTHAIEIFRKFANEQPPTSDTGTTR